MASDYWNESIYPPVGVMRKTIAEVTYSLTAPGSKIGGSTILPRGNIFSRPEQILDDIRDVVDGIATFEQDNWRLDGSFTLPVPVGEQADFEVGWWSDVMSNAEGILSPSLTIQHTFDEIQDFKVFGITFDEIGDNYCTDFELTIYNAYDQVIYNNRITNNNTAHPELTVNILGALRWTLSLYKTNKPYRWVRIIEIDFGIVLFYNNDIIQELSLVREADEEGKSCPIPEFKLKIINDGNYDVVDINSYAPYFKTRQRFNYKHGLRLADGSFEFVNCGTFYLSDWSVTDKNVEFTAHGSVSDLKDMMFYESDFEEKSLIVIARSVLPKVEITLDSPPITNYFENISLMDMLDILTELSCCLVYEGLNNAVVFNDIQTNYYPAVDLINYSQIYNSPEVSLSKYYNAINLSEYTISLEDSQISRTREKPGFIRINFKNPLLDAPEIIVEPGYSVTNVEYRPMYLTAILEGPVGSEEVEVTIKGQSADLVKNEVLYYAPWHTQKEPDRIYSIDLPCMIRTPNFSEFRDWFLKRKFEQLAMRMITEIDWRQNPDLQISDKINVQINNLKSNTNVFITKQEIEYDGALKGLTRTVGRLVTL